MGRLKYMDLLNIEENITALLQDVDRFDDEGIVVHAEDEPLFFDDEVDHEVDAEWRPDGDGVLDMVDSYEFMEQTRLV